MTIKNSSISPKNIKNKIGSISAGSPTISVRPAPGLERWTEDVAGGVIDVVDVATDLPNKARKLADTYTDFIIDKADELKARATGKAEENLKKSKISSIADNAGQWISNNLPIAGAVALVVLFLIFRK